MYTSKAKIENYLMVDINDSFAAQVNHWISAAESYINWYTGRSDGFESGSTETVKYFEGNGMVEFIVDTFVSIGTMEILELNGTDVEYTLTEGISNDFITYPYNTTPKYKLIMVPDSQIGWWPKGKRRIKITGVWGDSATVPADIELAATMLASQVVEKGQRGGDIASEELGDYSVTFRGENQKLVGMNIKKLLDKYKLIRL